MSLINEFSRINFTLAHIHKPETVNFLFFLLKVENHDNCVYDYVEVRDGHLPDSPLLGTYCGYKLPPDVRSSSNKLQIKFVSDSTVQKAGFSASFMVEFDECKTTDHGCEHECVNTLGTYECACKIGYELHSDGKHCEGDPIEKETGKNFPLPSFLLLLLLLPLFQMLAVVFSKRQTEP